MNPVKISGHQPIIPIYTQDQIKKADRLEEPNSFTKAVLKFKQPFQIEPKSLHEKEIIPLKKSQETDTETDSELMQEELMQVEIKKEPTEITQTNRRILGITDIRKKIQCINPHYDCENEIGVENCLPVVISVHNWVISGSEYPETVDAYARPEFEHMEPINGSTFLLQDRHLENLNDPKMLYEIDEDGTSKEYICLANELPLTFKTIPLIDIEKNVKSYDIPWTRTEMSGDRCKSCLLFLNHRDHEDQAHFLHLYYYEKASSKKKGANTIYVIDAQPQPPQIYPIKEFIKDYKDLYADEIKIWHGKNNINFNPNKSLKEMFESLLKKEDDESFEAPENFPLPNDLHYEPTNCQKRFLDEAIDETEEEKILKKQKSFSFETDMTRNNAPEFKENPWERIGKLFEGSFNRTNNNSFDQPSQNKQKIDIIPSRCPVFLNQPNNDFSEESSDEFVFNMNIDTPELPLANISLTSWGIHLHDEVLLSENVSKSAPKYDEAYNNLANTVPQEGFDQIHSETRKTKQELYLKEIALNPNNAQAYFNLATTLPRGGIIQLLDGTLKTQQELYLLAIALDPHYAAAYNNLATTLPLRGSIQLLDGTLKTQQELYLKAIALDSNYAQTYYNLASTLPLGGFIQLLDGAVMTEQMLYLKAIALDPNFAVVYHNLANTLPLGGSIQLLDGTLKTQEELFLKAIALDPNFARAYNNLANTLSRGRSIQLLDGTQKTQEELYLKAIALDPNYAQAYYNLATILPMGGSIQLLDGTRKTKQELYLKIIALDPNFARAYHNLANTLPQRGSIQLLDGTLKTQQELYLKTIELDPSFAVAYNNLATTLSMGGSIQLLDGTRKTKSELYLKAIALDPNDAKAYSNLAYTLSRGRSIQLFDGTQKTQEELYLKAIALDPNYAQAYYNLATILPMGGSIQLLDGTRKTKQELYLKIIALDPNFARAYHNLANTLPQRGSIQLLDGTLTTQQKLYLKAIALDPNFAKAYYNLACIIPQGGSIQLLDGTRKTKKEIVLKAIELNPNYAQAYPNLAYILPEGGSIQLQNSPQLNQVQPRLLKHPQRPIQPISLQNKHEIESFKNDILSPQPKFDVIAATQALAKNQEVMKHTEVTPLPLQQYNTQSIELTIVDTDEDEALSITEVEEFDSNQDM